MKSGRVIFLTKRKMALRDQPYIPLYVQDFLTDEKLIHCSAESTGVYIRIMCMMHKSDPYGTILLKQKDKQTGNQIKNFACKLAKFLPYHLPVIENSLIELIEEKVLQIEGDQLTQKRMIKDNKISLIRSESGKKGGKKSGRTPGNFAIPKSKAKPKANGQAKAQANSENEIEYENEVDNVIEKGKEVKEEKPKANPDFKTCIEIYDKFILEQTSTHAQIDGGEGKAMNSILSALSKTEKVEDGSKSIPEVWEYILKHRDSWDTFHQTQLKIKQINSNLVNILTVLKNGNPRKQSKNAGASELAILAKAAENGAIIDLDAKYGKSRH